MASAASAAEPAFGEPIRGFIERRFRLALIAALAVIVFGFVLVRYVF